MTTTFENAKKGDKVFDYIFQEWGVVDERSDKYSVVYACFAKHGLYSYHLDGKYYKSDAVPRIFWDEVPPIVAPSKPVEVPPVDTLVMVWDFDKEKTAALRYSVGEIKNRKLLCWNNGTTSKTASGAQEWKHWERVND